MTIYFFTITNGVFQAGFKYNGFRHISAICQQGSRYYVTTGSKVNRDLKRHELSAKQVQKYLKFRAGTDPNYGDYLAYGGIA